MFERYTEPAQQVVIFAREEARVLKHNYIGTEHILLGLLREWAGPAGHVLRSFGVTAESVRAEVMRLVGQDEEVLSEQIPFGPDAKKALELAVREASSFDQNYIGTDHILLALVRSNDGLASRILVGFDADLTKVYEEIIRITEGPKGHHWKPRNGHSVSFASSLSEEAASLVETLADEISKKFSRNADAGDLLVALACVADGIGARTLARLDIDANSLSRAAEQVRREHLRESSHPSPELTLEIERVKNEKDAKLEAGEFQEVAALRDAERQLRNEARRDEERQLQERLAEVRSSLGLPGG